MGFIGNLFSGNRGMGWNASGTNIAQPTTTGQAQTAYDQTQQGLQQQQAFLQALQGQGGIANQSSVFGQQQNLANLMQGVATGTGPNPALAQLNQTTGQNIAAMNAALSGARGAGANPALMARQAARQGSELQQQAVGQGATLAAQQQIAGMDALSRQQQQMAGLAGTQVGQQASAVNAYSTAAQNQQQNLLASINAQNQANVAMQSNINNANAALQGKIAEGQQGLFGGFAGAAGQGLGLLASKIATPALASTGVGLPAAAMFGAVAATGGRVKQGQIGNNPRAYLADGGDPAGQTVQRTNAPRIDENKYSIDIGTPEPNSGAATIQKGVTQFGKSIFDPFKTPLPPELGEGMSPLRRAIPAPDVSDLGTNYRAFPKEQMAKGGKVPAMVSPGEKYLTPEQAQSVLKGKENPLNGQTIPGKAKVKGDSYENDTVPVTLEEGGCVIPRSVLQSDQPMKNAIKFVHAHMKKMAKGGKVDNKKQPKQENIKIVEDDMFEPKASPEALEKMGVDKVHPEVQKAILQQPHVLFSPGNPYHPVSLDMTPDEVLHYIKKSGFVAEPAVGAYGSREPSIMVHNVSREQLPFLFKLAKRLGQDSAIFSQGGEHEAHYLNGPNEGKVARGSGTVIHKEEPEDFYTKTKNGLIFSHNIDWDKLYDK